MTKIKLISESDDLADCVNTASNSKWLGVDTEFLREKTYYPLLCLIQVQSETDAFCVDVLAMEDLAPLQELMVSEKIEKIFHSCRQDLEALDLRFTESPCNLYDTQIAAAFCGHGDQVSYASLVESVCGVCLDKSHTRTNWSARPLSPAQLNYAVEDVKYLKDLRDFLDNQLSGLGRQAWHRDECEKVLKLKDYRIDPGDAWKRLKGGAKIPSRYQNSAKALAIWREQKAQKSDRPREWILSTQALIDICLHKPVNVSDLAKLDSVNHGVVRKSGDSILEIFHGNLGAETADPIWQKFGPLDNEQRSRVKQIMSKLKQVAADSNLSQSILANRSDIESLVSGKKDIPLLQGWRYEFIGKQLVAELL